MTTHAVLTTFAEITALWWLFAWLYYDYRLELLRTRLFLARDQLFCAAAEGKIAFDEPAYLMTRTTLNGALRFAHRLTLSKLLITALWLRRHDPQGGSKYHARLEDAMRKLNLDQKKLILDTRLQLHYALLSHVAHVSLLTFPMAMLFKLGLRLHLWRSHRFTKRARSEMETIDAHAFDLGRQASMA
jgi:hypothetical protein